MTSSDNENNNSQQTELSLPQNCNPQQRDAREHAEHPHHFPAAPQRVAGEPANVLPLRPVGADDPGRVAAQVADLDRLAVGRDPTDLATAAGEPAEEPVSAN